MSIKIVTDSTCDLPSSITNEYGITVLPLYINMNDRGYLDGVEMTREEFYRRLPEHNPPPTTAASSPERFRQLYDSLAMQGASQILSIHISSALSSTLDTARVAAQETHSVPVTVFDSRQLSLGTGFLVETAARAAKQGCTLEEIVAQLQDQIGRTQVFAALDTLEYLRRSGRLNGAVSAMGTLLQIKPLLRMYDGKPTVERVRTRERATERLLELLGAMGELERIAVVHSHAPERVSALRERAATILPPNDGVVAMDITPVIGAHIGPGAVGFAAVAKRPWKEN